jgi:hypothetical protein
MQVAYFATGGFVLHKIPYGAGKLSAWFGADGELVDIAKFDVNGRKTGQGIVAASNAARAIGKRYINKQ